MPVNSTADAASPCLVVTDLGHRFGTAAWLFRHLDTIFLSGTVTALTGPSGCGKSTLLAILGRQLTATEGTVTTAGVDRVGWVPQHPYGVRQRSAIDHVVVPYLARHCDRATAQARAGELLERVGLSHAAQRPFSKLSGGEAQRLGLARAIAAEHDLLLIDEPTAQLDPGSAAVVIDLIRDLAQPGRIVVLSTHDPRLADTTDQTINLLREAK